MTNVVLVDSDRFSRGIFERILSHRGYKVSTYDSTSRVPAHCVTDECLCVVDSNEESLEWLKERRATGWRGRIVLLSSVFEPLAEPLSAMATLVIQKPVSPLEFAVQVDSLRTTALDEISDTELGLDSVVLEASKTVEDGLTELEELLHRSRRDPLLLDTLRDRAQMLQILTRQSGLDLVSSSLARLEQGAAAARDGRLNPHVWAELRDVLDTAIIEARREQIEHVPPPKSRHVSNLVVVTEDECMVADIEKWSAENLIGVIRASEDDFLDVLRDPQVDGVLMDASRPRAFELTREARERQRTQDVPVTLLMPQNMASQTGAMEFRVEAAHVGAERILEKPMERNEFLESARFMTGLRRAAKPHVLLVEDDPHSVSEIRSYLESIGMAVSVRESAAKIVQDLGLLDPDVLIVSATLPGVNGLDACRIVRATPRFHDLPVIAISTQGGTRARVAGFRAGVDDFLTKPIARDELHARLAIRIERMRRHRERADVDLLTGLLTRRAFLEQVSLRISESRRKRREFALCIIDLDRFKEVNDVHGHLVGDKVLAQLGRLLKNRFRHEDLRCRWGGEEFAILLVDEGAVTARQVVHRVLEEFREITFHGDTGEEFHSTFSGGIAEFDTDSDQFEGLMRVADERLYQAKLAGRNRIAI